MSAPTFFVYPAVLGSVLDGDTIDVTLDLGFDMWHKVRVRVSGIDTPEVRNYKKHKYPQGEVGRAVRKVVELLLLDAEGIWVRSISYGKYAKRIVGELWFRNSNGEVFSLAQFLLDHEMAQVYDGGTRPRWGKKHLEKAYHHASMIGTGKGTNSDT